LFEGLVGPEAGFAEFAKLDQRPHLASPGGGEPRAEFNRLGVTSQSGFKVCLCKSRLRLAEIMIRVGRTEWTPGLTGRLVVEL